MRSYRVHACNPESNPSIPYLLVSLVGAGRISLDFRGMGSGLAITLDALYDLLQGTPIVVDRNDGQIRLCPDGDQLIIEQESVHHTPISLRVWMAELALAWNMLAGCGASESMPAWRHP